MNTIIAGNTLLQVIVSLGICIGVLGGIATSFKDLRELEPLHYTGAKTQFFNRLLFVIACVMCLFVDFPGRHEHPLSMFNWIAFPFLGAVILLLSWLLAFYATIAAKYLFYWVTASLRNKS